MKGKTAGFNRIFVEMLRAGQCAITSPLLTFVGQAVECQRIGAFVVHLTKEKGLCKIYRGISLLTIV